VFLSDFGEFGAAPIRKLDHLWNQSLSVFFDFAFLGQKILVGSITLLFRYPTRNNKLPEAVSMALGNDALLQFLSWDDCFGCAKTATNKTLKPALISEGHSCCVFDLLIPWCWPCFALIGAGDSGPPRMAFWKR